MKFTVVLEVDGQEVEVEIDPTRRLSDDEIELFLLNEAALYPLAHPHGNPITKPVVARLAATLGVPSSAQLRLELHETISGTLAMLTRGWKGPRWLRSIIARIRTADPEVLAGLRVTRDALRGLVHRGVVGDEVRSMLLESLVQSARDHGADLKLPQRDISERGGVASTPLYDFSRATLGLLAARGAQMLEADTDMPDAKRMHVGARLREYAGLAESPLVNALARARATILQETPMPWAHRE